MNGNSTSMWHWDRYEPEELPKPAEQKRKLPALLPFDPDMVLVFAGPGGLPYLVRMLVRYRFVQSHTVISVPAAQRLAS